MIIIKYFEYKTVMSCRDYLHSIIFSTPDFLSLWPWSCFPVLGFRTSRAIYSVCLLLNFTNRKTILSLYSEFMVIVFVCSLINTSDRVTSLSQTSVLDRRDTVFWCVRGHPVLSFIVNRLFYNLWGHFSQSRPSGKNKSVKKITCKVR